METEKGKDKHPPEKSNNHDHDKDQDHEPDPKSKDPTQDNHDHDKDHDPEPNPKSNPNPDKEHHQNDDIENSIPSEPPTESESKTETTEEETKEEEETATNVEESHPPPDFNKVCEEIDLFISALSSARGDESDQDLPDVPEVMEQFAFLVEAKIANYDPSELTTKWTHLSGDDSLTFLETVYRVSKLTNSLCEFSSESKYAASINRVGGILQRAMSYLEDEFRSLLEDPKIPELDHNNDLKTEQSPSEEPNSAGDNNFPGYSEEVVSDLSKLAKAMMKGGYETECFQVYIVARRSILEETLHKLGFVKFSIDEVQKIQWEPLEREIVTWNKMFRQCVSVLFTGERKLAAAVFSGEFAADGIFGSLMRIIVVELLNFAEAIAMSKRSSEKLFKFLDVYETLRDAIPTMDNLFPEEIVNEVKSEASITRTRLGEVMVCIFCELENSIKADTGKTQVPGGAVHPLTRYIMNYLEYACEYKETLEQVFKEHQKIERADSATGSNYDSNNQSGQNQANWTVAKLSPFCIQINKVMDLLDTNLETRSKLYKDTSLSSIFMMNNGRYILQKIKASGEINELMGDTWSRKRSSDLRQYHKNYRLETWGRLLGCLNPEGLIVHGKVVKPVLKEKFKSFNTMFDEIHKAQSTWVVSDEQLQSELRVSISAVVIPAYRSFMARFSQTFTPGRQTEKYIKYQPEDIETHIDELFDGNATPTGRRKP